MNYVRIGDFAGTAASIARQVGIITVRESDVKKLSDLPRDLPISEVENYDDDKLENGRPMQALVLSGSEILTMTECQWRQVWTVRQAKSSGFVVRVLMGNDR